MAKALRQPAASGIDKLFWLWGWGGFAGPIVELENLAPVITAGTAGWICAITIDGVYDHLLDLDSLAAAVGAADCIIIANIDDIDATTGALAAGGLRVLVIDRLNGAVLPAAMAKALM